MTDRQGAIVASDWPEVEPDVLTHVRTTALQALGTANSGDLNATSDRLLAYYDPAGLYAGSTYLDAGPVDPWAITSSDLFAVSMLSVNSDARSSRRFLEHGPYRGEVVEALGGIAADATLDRADTSLLAKMERLYRVVKLTLAPPGNEATSNKWVRASKICARKRPELFPVRDRIVCDVLGISHLGDFRKDWQVFRFLMTDLEVVGALERVAEHAATAAVGSIRLDSPRLRLLDVVLWTYGVGEFGQDPQQPDDE